MLESRRLSIQLRPLAEPVRGSELERLLNASFPVPAGASFYDDFPVWDPRYGVTMMRLGAYTEKRLISTASVRLAQLKAPAGTIPVALIGAVATAKDWQGKGLASMTVAAALAWAAQQRATAVFLWGSEHALYERQGFDLCGVQARVPLRDIEVTRVIGGSEPKLKTGWDPALFELLKKRESGLVIGSNDEAWISAHRNVSWYWLAGTGGAPLAYAAVGRGIDLTNFVHEWGGTPEAIGELLYRVRELNPSAELLAAPFLLRNYGIHVDRVAGEFLCMARILDAQVFARAFQIQFASASATHAARVIGTPEDPFAALPLWLWGLDGA